MLVYENFSSGEDITEHTVCWHLEFTILRRQGTNQLLYTVIVISDPSASIPPC